MSWVWIEGGVAQDHSDDVIVIDTDVSDFVDEDSLEQAERVFLDALESGAPRYVVEAAREARDDVKRRLGR